MKVFSLSDLHCEFSKYILKTTFSGEDSVLASDCKVSGRSRRTCVLCGASGSQLNIGRDKVTLCGDCFNKYQSQMGTPKFSWTSIKDNKMKLHIISDLHNEFSKYHIQVKDADVVILAGDIGVGTQGFQYAKSLLLETSSRILFVPGNHEYYSYHVDLMRSELRYLFREAASDRLFFLDCDEVVIDGVRFLGTTMWTDFRLFGESRRHECLSEARYLNDFRIIKYGNGDVFRPRDSVEVFNHSVDWLTKKLNQPFDGRTVVITHHLPSFDSVVERYRDDILSACFASNLDHLFGKCDLWVHGHTHDNLDYVKNGTRVVCNPRGYCRYEGDEENLNFDPQLIIEI